MPKDINQRETQKWQGYLSVMNSQGEFKSINKAIIEECVHKLHGEEIAPEDPNMPAIVNGIAGNCVKIALPEKGTAYRLSFEQIIQSEKIILYWLHKKKAPMYKDFKNPDSSIGAPSIAHSSYTPALAERIRREMCRSSTNLRISKRIKDSIDVLRLIRDLFLKDKTEKIANQRKKATTIIAAERGVADRTIIAHLLGKNIPSKLSTVEFDNLLKKWLINDSDKLKEWFVKHANHSEIAYINNFFDQPNFLYSPLASDIKEHVADKDYGEETEFPEGREIERKHKLRERNQAVIKSAKEAFKRKNGKLYCQVCNFDFYENYGEIGYDFIEGHHTIPISELKGEIKTQVKDVALVCSNCHRMLHRKRPWLKMADLKKLIIKKA